MICKIKLILFLSFIYLNRANSDNIDDLHNPSLFYENEKEIFDKNKAESSDPNECIRNLSARIDTFSVSITANNVLNNSLGIFGRINQNVSANIFLNHTCGGIHLMSIYGTYIKNKKSTNPIIDSNIDVENVMESLKDTSWDYSKNVTERTQKAREIVKSKFTKSRNDEMKNLTKEFMDNFYIDTHLEKCLGCECDSYYLDKDKNVLFCFTPWFSQHQLDILYAEFQDRYHYITYSSYVQIVSVGFMVLTLLVYMILKELRKNVYGKCVVMYLVSFSISTVMFSVLGITGTDTRQMRNILGILCVPTGFTAQYFWLTTFTIQTVMCFDILNAFRAMRNPNLNKSQENTKFLYYCAYAYGLPAVITLITIVMQFGPFFEGTNYKPNIGHPTCFFPKLIDNTVRWIYLFGPYGSMIALNSTMFIATVLMIWKHSKAAKKLRNSSFRKNTPNKPDKDMFQVHLTLFIVMGTNWFFELIIMILRDTTTPDTLFWRTIDIFNSSIGLLFFVVLVLCKPKVIRGLRQKYIDMKSKPDTQQTICKTATPSANNTTSTTITSLDDNSTTKV